MDRNQAIQRLNQIRAQSAVWESLTFREAYQMRETETPEGGHKDADRVLCDLLRALGYEDVVAAWEAIEPKWHA